MHRAHEFLAAMAVLASTAAYADPAPTTVQPQVDHSAVKAKVASGPTDVVCKNIVATGSRLGSSKTCMTRAQWADMARESSDYTAQRQVQSLRNGPVSGP